MSQKLELRMGRVGLAHAHSRGEALLTMPHAFPTTASFEEETRVG